jgi:hypothetical protein
MSELASDPKAHLFLLCLPADDAVATRGQLC